MTSYSNIFTRSAPWSIAAAIFVAQMMALSLRAQVEEEIPENVVMSVKSTRHFELAGTTIDDAYGHLITVKPWKTYVSTGYKWTDGYTVTFYPPTGYTVWVDGVEQQTFNAPGSGYSGYDYHSIELRPKSLFAPGQIGEATAVQFPAPVVWGVSLGSLLNGKSAGHLF